ncbi:hypothetical protein ABGB12_34200 [Actinocorallia sp. B10E7]|uniref:hypothetical protein n=1 Tax=Actinocorallia sp. B10E7 TaxID=3153558 RepID=UPI00325F2CF2
MDLPRRLGGRTDPAASQDALDLVSDGTAGPGEHGVGQQRVHGLRRGPSRRPWTASA